MNDDLFRAVVELEKTIQKDLEKEQLRATAWATREVELLEQDLLDYQHKLNAREANWQRVAEERLRLRWQHWETVELERIECFSRFADQEIQTLLEGVLPRILPGAEHDHQDVEG